MLRAAIDATQASLEAFAKRADKGWDGWAFCLPLIASTGLFAVLVRIIRPLPATWPGSPLKDCKRRSESEAVVGAVEKCGTP